MPGKLSSFIRARSDLYHFHWSFDFVLPSSLLEWFCLSKWLMTTINVYYFHCAKRLEVQQKQFPYLHFSLVLLVKVTASKPVHCIFLTSLSKNCHLQGKIFFFPMELKFNQLLQWVKGYNEQITSRLNISSGATVIRMAPAFSDCYEMFRRASVYILSNRCAPKFNWSLR